ncbi:hypothetical protein [Williamsia sp. DF01-3]|uniref:hypothetical protein n=1 Tax=Williamsia sp. DF01-3 TaxID=2934157 RepID=UPI001FF32C29|nr:hypothetical protein [Williamsia sp. DF01-3]MCK0515722.1 hypothetical protein [Williamsia sp. DF01-3]
MKLAVFVRRTALGVALSGAAAFGFAPSAVAAPSDVTLTPSVVGNTVTISIANGSDRPVACTIAGFNEGSDPLVDEAAFGYATPNDPLELVPMGSQKAVQMRLEGVDENGFPGPVGSTEIPDGDYEIYYGCRTLVLEGVEEPEYWGTNPPLDDETTTFAEVIRVSVPGGDTPPPACSGSLCGLTLTDLLPAT